MVAHSLRAEGFDASEDGTGRGTPLVPVGVDLYNQSVTGDVAATLNAQSGAPNHSGPRVLTPIAFHPTQDPISSEGAVHALGTGSSQGCATAAVAFQQTADCLTAAYGTKWNGNASATNGSLFAGQAMQVRRLTPVECERLQGFPDDYTLVSYRGKPAADGPRYKALGNSMAVPVMAWIGRRIQAVQDVVAGLERRDAA